MDEGHFDYRSVSETGDDLDFGKLSPCPHCGKPIPNDATMCLYCGRESVRRNKNPRVAIAIFLLVISLIAFFLMSG